MPLFEKTARPGAKLFAVGDRVTFDADVDPKDPGFPALEVCLVTDVRKFATYQKLTLDRNPKRTVDQDRVTGNCIPVHVRPYVPGDDVRIQHREAASRVAKLLDARNVRRLLAFSEAELKVMADRIQAFTQAADEI